MSDYAALNNADAMLEAGREKDRYGGERSSRDDRDRHHHSSRREYEDDRYSRRGDDRRHRDPEPRRGGRREYDDYRGGGGSGRYDEDRRRDDYGRRGRDDDHRGSDRRGGGGGGRGGGRGSYGRDGVGTPDKRSPTPEGTVSLSQRKRKASGWDVHAPGYEQYTAMQAKQTGMFNLPGANRAQMPVVIMGPNNAPPPPPLISFPQAAAFGVGGANPNLARQSRRLYIGSITYEANEENLASFFNEKMIEMGIGTGAPGDPVVAVQVNHEKSYAFVEFRSAEDATSAMAFDGIIFQNGPLKIRRPKDYSGSDLSAPSGMHVPGVVSTNVPDSINKIFVGGLPTYLNEEQVMELLKSFGELKAFNLVKDATTNLSKGFAFFEYVDPSVTDIATQGLNGMELGDRFLVVQRASIGAKPGMAGMPGMPSVEEYQNAMRRPIMPLAVDGSQTTNRILLMLNMVTPEDLSDDQEYSDIYEDIKEECAGYGQVDDLRIPRPVKKDKNKWVPGGDGEGSITRINEDAGVGRVYVKFATPDGANAALRALAGRAFAGRSIVATLLADDADSSPPLDVIFSKPAETNGNA